MCPAFQKQAWIPGAGSNQVSYSTGSICFSACSASADVYTGSTSGSSRRWRLRFARFALDSWIDAESGSMNSRRSAVAGVA